MHFCGEAIYACGAVFARQTTKMVLAYIDGSLTQQKPIYARKNN